MQLKIDWESIKKITEAERRAKAARDALEEYRLIKEMELSELEQEQIKKANGY